MNIPNSFYTIETLFSLTGSATAVWIKTSVTGYVLELKNSRKFKKLLGLTLSISLALLGVTQIQEKTSLTWVVAFINGFLIYLTAVGANTITASGSEPERAPIRETSVSGRTLRGEFTERWWQ